MRWRGPARTLITTVLAAVVLWGIVAGIAGSGSRDRVRSLTERLKCPVCQGESVAESPSATAQDIVKVVRSQVAQGWSDDRILQFYVDRYGEQILLDPPRSGSTLLLWAVPLLAVTGGAVALVSRLEPSRLRRVLVVSAASLGIASTAVLVIVGANERTPREAAALEPADPSGSSGGVDLAAVTNEEMEAQIAKTPDIVGMRLALVERYLDDGEFAKAYVHTSIAINLPATDQEYERALKLHGWVSALNGAPASGAQFLKAALTLSPTDNDALWWLANVEFDQLGNAAEARRALDQIVADDMTATQHQWIAALSDRIDAALAAGAGSTTTVTVATSAGSTVGSTP